MWWPCLYSGSVFQFSGSTWILPAMGSLHFYFWATITRIPQFSPSIPVQKLRLWVCLPPPNQLDCIFLSGWKISLCFHWPSSWQQCLLWLEQRLTRQRESPWTWPVGVSILTDHWGLWVGVPGRGPGKCSDRDRLQRGMAWDPEWAGWFSSDSHKWKTDTHRRQGCNLNLRDGGGGAWRIFLQGPHNRWEGFQRWEPKPWGLAGQESWPSQPNPVNSRALLLPSPRPHVCGLFCVTSASFYSRCFFKVGAP